MAAYDITALSSPLEFDTSNGTFNAVLKWSSTRVVNVWNGSANNCIQVQAFDVNSGTGAVTAIGSPLNIKGDNNDMNGAAIVVVDSTHFMVVWRDGNAPGVFARICAIDGSGVITTAGATLTVSTITDTPNLSQIDSTHWLLIGSGAGSDGFASVLAVDTGTWAITQPAAALEFDTANFAGSSFTGHMVRAITSTHHLASWKDSGGSAVAQVLSVNTGTWEVTALGTPLGVSSAGTADYISLVPLDGVNHFLHICQGNSSDGQGTVLEVNLSTWAVTNVGSGYDFDTGAATYVVGAQLDSTHVVVIWAATSTLYAQTLAVNGSWDVSGAGSILTLYNGGAAEYSSVELLNGFRFVSSWSGASADGFIQAIDVEGAGAGGNAFFMGANF